MGTDGSIILEALPPGRNIYETINEQKHTYYGMKIFRTGEKTSYNEEVLKATIGVDVVHIFTYYNQKLPCRTEIKIINGKNELVFDITDYAKSGLLLSICKGTKPIDMEDLGCKIYIISPSNGDRLPFIEYQTEKYEICRLCGLKRSKNLVR